jgi:hypothetical protein
LFQLTASAKRLGDRKPARGQTVLISEKVDFTARLLHALVIAGLLFHLKITELLLKCIYCVDGRLKADMEVTCFEGEHELTFAIAVTLLVFYSLGYPLAALAVLCKNKRKKKVLVKEPHVTVKRHQTLRMGRTISIHDVAQAKMRSSLGVLFDDCRDSFFWWHSVQFLFNWCVAILVAFNPAPDFKLFCMAILDLSIVTFIYARKPFTERGDNRTAVTFGLVAAIQSIVLLVAAAMLTLPIPAINLPEWLAVPPPMVQDTTATVAFAVIPFVWLLAFTVIKPAHAIYRLCHCCGKAQNGGKTDAKGLKTDESPSSHSETFDDKASGTLAALATSAHKRRLGGLAAAVKKSLGSPKSVFKDSTKSIISINGIQAGDNVERSPSILRRSNCRKLSNVTSSNNDNNNGSNKKKNKTDKPDTKNMDKEDGPVLSERLNYEPDG